MQQGAPNTEPLTNDASNDMESFNFFVLPREIRDIIYSGGFDTVKRISGTKTGTTQMRDFPSSHLLLVNKQFKEELLEMITKSTCTLTVESKCNFRLRLHKMPKTLKQVRHINVELVCACYCPSCLRKDCNRLVTALLRTILSTTRSPTLTIKMCLQLDFDEYEHWANNFGPTAAIVTDSSLENAKSMTLDFYRCKYMDELDDSEVSKQGLEFTPILAAKYSREHMVFEALPSH